MEIKYLKVYSPDFSQDFYCEAAMPRTDCVALGLDAQRTSSMSARPNYRAPCYYMALRSLATKLVRNPG